MTSGGRRAFLAAGAGAAALALVGTRYWWITRRVLVRAGVMQPPANRLRNAAFLQCTHVPVPDYWGMDAAAHGVDVAAALGLDDDSPVEGARSMRLQAVAGAGELTVMAARSFVPQPTPYTLSAYVRADAPGRTARLHLGWDAPATVAVGPEWRRVSTTCVPLAEASRRAALQARFSLVGEGRLWLAAPQLETGTAATGFATALLDDRPLPSLPWSADGAWTPPLTETEDTDPVVLASERPAIGDRHHRAFLVGRRPRLVTAVAVRAPDARHLADIAAHGFDAVALIIPSDDGAGAPRDQTRQWFDEAARHGLGVVALLSRREEPSIDALTTDVVRSISALKDHPALLYWIVLDEPTRAWSFPPWSEIPRLLTAARREDPNHPVVVNHNVWSNEGAALLSASDAGSVDVYPIGQYANSVQAVADMALRLNRACSAAGKPAAMWLQMYGYDDAVREPTPAEERAMTYAAFVHGTRALSYWIYKPMSTGLWASMQGLNAELRRLDGAIVTDRSRCVRTGTTNGRVHYSLWAGGDRSYLIAVNVGPDTALVSFGMQQDRSPWRIRSAWYPEAAHMPVGRHLWARMPPYGRQVWELETT